MNKDIAKILITAAEIEAKCQELGAAISADYRNRTVVLVGLLKGCVPFLADLMKHITCPVEVEYLSASSYEGKKSTGEVKITLTAGLNLAGKDVLIVDDIIDTGLSTKKVYEYILAHNVNSMETVCLLDKPEGRIIDVGKPKYIGFEIPNEFVVGYGLDYNQLYRNLPYIGILKPEAYSKEAN